VSAPLGRKGRSRLSERSVRPTEKAIERETGRVESLRSRHRVRVPPGVEHHLPLIV